MWTPATRGRMAEFEKKTKRYPTDLTDEEWARIAPFLPGAAKSGRPARTDLREVLNAIRYLARSGGGSFKTTKSSRSGTCGRPGELTDNDQIVVLRRFYLLVPRPTGRS